jgi:hypothetical protein
VAREGARGATTAAGGGVRAAARDAKVDADDPPRYERSRTTARTAFVARASPDATTRASRAGAAAVDRFRDGDARGTYAASFWNDIGADMTPAALPGRDPRVASARNDFLLTDATTTTRPVAFESANSRASRPRDERANHLTRDVRSSLTSVATRPCRVSLASRGRYCRLGAPAARGRRREISVTAAVAPRGNVRLNGDEFCTTRTGDFFSRRAAAARRMTIRIYDESAREKSEACVIVRIMRA